MAAANSPWAPAYEAFWQTRLVIGPEAHPLSLTAQQWVNDALMAVFFLLVGLEIKRELLVGELSTPAPGGPALRRRAGRRRRPGAALYLALAPAEAQRAAGRSRRPPTSPLPWACWRWWRRGAPAGLKVFLAALAIVDDMAAVLVIALFYTATVHWAALGAAGRGRCWR